MTWEPAALIKNAHAPSKLQFNIKVFSVDYVQAQIKYFKHFNTLALNFLILAILVQHLQPLILYSLTIGVMR